MQKKQTIELLSPARNLECGKAAIDCGADAVYIGASAFSARAAAGNSVADIAALVKYAHFYNTKVYVALNTVLFDDEIEQAEQLAWDVFYAGADALIIQDMGLLECKLPPIEIHASTQTDNRNIAKIQFLEQAGFSQIVLARELSFEQIAEIRKQTGVKLEYFIHGALCVSYSGQCYMSCHATGRSANRGACAQMCRHSFDLVDEFGHIIEKNKYLLSLRDLNLSNHLDKLIDSGINSLKIEGRLKDISYVKNITAFYRSRIDELLASRPNIAKSSSGKVEYGFTPDTHKTFARPFTDFFIEGKRKNVVFTRSPKSLGEFVGTVDKSEKNILKVDSEVEFSNGDGLCFFTLDDQLNGIRVNRAEGHTLHLNSNISIPKGTKLYRNHSVEFEKMVVGDKTKRKIGVNISFEETEDGFILHFIDEDGIEASSFLKSEKENIKNKDSFQATIKNQLQKLGNSPFYAIQTSVSDIQSFLKASQLNELRRSACERLTGNRLVAYRVNKQKHHKTSHPYIRQELSYQENIANEKARKFYERHGATSIMPAYELKKPLGSSLLMTTKHCVKFHLHACPHEASHKRHLNEPLYLKDKTGIYELRFNCKNCEMQVYSCDNATRLSQKPASF